MVMVMVLGWMVLGRLAAISLAGGAADKDESVDWGDPEPLRKEPT